jgi:uncharacterized integral membrane protein
MNGTKPFTMLASVIFAVVALIHLFRLWSRFHVVFGTHAVPVWVSIIGFVVPGILSVMLYREARGAPTAKD